mgnify:CR=1 FL=1
MSQLSVVRDDPIGIDDYYRFRAIFEPYQIRLDQVPGETNFEKNGVPRVYDANLDVPGLGLEPPNAEWGLMLKTLRPAIYMNTMVAAMPGRC